LEWEKGKIEMLATPFCENRLILEPHGDPVSSYRRTNLSLQLVMAAQCIVALTEQSLQKGETLGGWLARPRNPTNGVTPF